MTTETELCLNVLISECCSKQATIAVLFVKCLGSEGQQEKPGSSSSSSSRNEYY